MRGLEGAGRERAREERREADGDGPVLDVVLPAEAPVAGAAGGEDEDAVLEPREPAWVVVVCVGRGGGGGAHVVDEAVADGVEKAGVDGAERFAREERGRGWG